MVQKNMFYQHYHGLTCHHPSVHHHRIYMAPLSHHGVLLFFVNTWWDSGIYIYIIRLPSGILTLLLKITVFNGYIIYIWPFSIAMWVYRVFDPLIFCESTTAGTAGPRWAALQPASELWLTGYIYFSTPRCSKCYCSWTYHTIRYTIYINESH